MDTSRISFGEMIAAVSAVLLFLFMFVFDWFGVKETPGGASAWQWFSLIDILLFLVIVIAIVAAVLQAVGGAPNLPAPAGQIVLAAGAIAVVLILLRIIFPGDGPFPFDVEATRKIGAFLGLLAAVGIAFGGFTAMNERARGAAPGGRPSSPGGTPPGGGPGAPA